MFKLDPQQFVEMGTVRPDPRGRLTLAKRKDQPWLQVDGYRQYQGPGGEILLVPLAEIPARERWVHENPEVKAAILRGMADVAAGRVHVFDPGEFPFDDE